MENQNKEQNKEQELTREQALNVVKQVCEAFKGNFQEHVLIQQSLQLLSKPCECKGKVD